MFWMLAGVALQAAQAIGAANTQKTLDKIENKRTKEYNKLVRTQAAKSFNEIAVQKSVLSAQTAQALTSVDSQGLQLKAQRGLQAAGTDTMGASVEQNLADVDMKVADAKYLLQYNEQISDLSLNAAVDQVADSATGATRIAKPVLNTWGAALGSVAGNFAVSAFENKAKTGSFMGNTASRNQGLN
ncbi:putative internal virion protein A [Pseudomonas phage Ep4]|uniref:Internal virion protein A n=1 Tax=Pseudomonas phage Ep4 TaxID=3057492 RepID=A0AAU9E6V8_9CAUD|nr:putative internal virion protein A [Pseudomonas phage Ep4]